MDVLAYSANDDSTRIGHVTLNGDVVWQGLMSARGVNTLLIDPFFCSVRESRCFDTHASSKSARKLRDYMHQLKSGAVIVGVTADEPSKKLSSALSTLQEFGVDVDDVRYRGSFAFVAQKGYPYKTALNKVLTTRASNRAPAHVNAFITGAYEVL